MNPLPVSIRAAESVRDWTFIRKAWLSTFWYGGAGVHGSDKEHYGSEMLKLFSVVMPKAHAILACDNEDSDNRLGFSVYEGDALWFVYVMKDFRRTGIVPAMLGSLAIKRYNQCTIQGAARLKPRLRGWIYTPRLVLGAIHGDESRIGMGDVRVTGAA